MGALSRTSSEGPSSKELRVLALWFVVLPATGGVVAGLVAGGTEHLVPQALAGGILLLLVGILLSPLPDRFVWTSVVVLAPACFGLGIRWLDAPEALVGILLVGVAWVATYLSRPLLALQLVSTSAAAAWVVAANADGPQRAVAVALWTLVPVAVGVVVAALAGELRGARAEMVGIAEGIGAHFYRGVLERDGTYTEVYTGPGFERLVGRAPSAEEEPGDVWMHAVHDDDREAYCEWLGSLGAGSSDELEYRLVGRDGEIRWVLERVRITAVDAGRVFHEGLVWDVTGRRMAERSLERTQRQLNDLIQAIDEVVLQYEPGPAGWRTTFVGPGLEQLAGLPASDGLDPLLESASLLDRRRIIDLRQQVLREGRGEIEYRIVDGSGRQRWISERLWARTDGGRTVVDAIASNVTERVLITAELATARDEAERRARTDPLTGLNNRLHFSERLDAEISRARRGGSPFGLVLLDLDRFKQLNDRHGHLAGDRALVAVATRLGERLRPYDVIARWGGEEFAVLLPQLPDEDSLAAVCESLRHAVAQAPVSTGSEDVRVTTSVGAVLASDPLVTSDELLQAADEALYRAKKRGRNQVDVAVAAESAAAPPEATVVTIAGRRRRVR